MDHKKFEYKGRSCLSESSVFSLNNQKEKKMKIFGFLLSLVLAFDSTLLMLMMQQNSVANPNQANQMNMMLPLLLLDDDDAKSAENKNLLIMMMMQGGEMGDTQSILPLLLLDDGDLDFKSFFLYSNLLRQGNLLI